MENYEQLLDEAYDKVKAVHGAGGRFEIPKIKGHFEGKKTILTNFSQIVSISGKCLTSFKTLLPK